MYTACTYAYMCELNMHMYMRSEAGRLRWELALPV